MRLFWLLRTYVDELSSKGAALKVIQEVRKKLEVHALAGCRREAVPGVRCLPSLKLPLLNHITLNLSMFLYLLKNLREGDAVLTDYNSVFAALPFVKKAKVVVDYRTLPMREGLMGALEWLSFELGTWFAKRFFWGATFITDQMREEVGEGFKRWTIRGSGVDLELFDPEKFDRERERARWGFEGTVFLYWGALESSQRGLLEAAQAFREAGLPEDAKLVFVGSGSLASELRELAEVREPVPFEKVPSLLVAADFAVIPFRRDRRIRVSFPIKLLEAMAMELPIVSTQAEPLPRFLKNYPLWFSAPEPQDLAEAFRRAYPFRGRRAEGARVLVEPYSYERQAKRLVDFLLEG